MSYNAIMNMQNGGAQPPPPPNNPILFEQTYNPDNFWGDYEETGNNNYYDDSYGYDELIFVISIFEKQIVIWNCTNRRGWHGAFIFLHAPASLYTRRSRCTRFDLVAHAPTSLHSLRPRCTRSDL